jgi:hypothetical protein
MRIPDDVHLAQPWRIHALVPDFELEDVWSLPEVVGPPEAFDDAVAMATTVDPAHGSSVAARVLWKARDLLGRWFDLGRVTGDADFDTYGVPGTQERSLAGRLPADLRDTVDGTVFAGVPFTPLYRTDREFAAEISNRTVHGVLHLSWVPRPDGLNQGHMAVYVKPRGRLGRAYMAFIKPFRYLVVYPALERQLARRWRDRAR